MKVLGLGLALSVLSSLSLFIVPCQADLTATSIFQTIPGNADGSCDDSKINNMVQEAASLTESAISAINKLLSGESSKLFYRNLLKNDQSNQRIARLAFAMFGVKIDEPQLLRENYFRVVSEDRPRLDDALRYYTLVKNKLYSGKIDGAKLVCGDKDWVYARTFGDLGWEDEDIKDEEINPGNPGVYYSKKYVVRKDDKTVDTEKSLLPDEPELNGKGLCTPPTAGETWAKWKFMMICDDVFTRPKLVDLYAEQKTLAVGTSVDKMQTAGAEMLHEMMHFINQQIGDYKFPNGNGGQRAAYFWKNCVALAMQSIDQENPDLALKNADNYRTFALAVALDLIDWDENGQVPDPNAAHDEEL